MPKLRFRPATHDDVERLVELDLMSYPEEGTGVAARRRDLVTNPLGDLSDMTVALLEDELVGCAFLYPLEAWFGGRPVSMGGVASVAVAPEARGRGVARAIMHHVHVLADARGDALTALYPFRQGFYAKLGYGPTRSRRRLAIDPRSIPDAWRALGRERVRRARGEDREAIEAVYARGARAATGWLTRSRPLWDRRLSRERRVYLVADAESGAAGVLSGYVAFELQQSEPNAATTIAVVELVADDDRARHALLGALGALRDQAVEIALPVDATDPLDAALVDPDGHRAGTMQVPHALGVVLAGPMVRLCDVTRAIEARGYGSEGSFDLVLDEATPSSHDGDELALSVEVSGGAAKVAAARRVSAALRMHPSTLASVLYGGLGVRDASRLGLVVAEPRALDRADEILRLPAPLPLDSF